jgi:hypothetical protein
VRLAHSPRRNRTLKTDWLKALDSAETLGEVIRVVEEFIESRSDVYWTGVPEGLQRPSIANEPQLQQWHHALVQAISKMPSPGSPMQELAVFTLRAAVRLHQIRLQDDKSSPSNEGGFGAAGPGYSRT